MYLDELSAETYFDCMVLLSPCRLLSFPTNLINASDTRRGIAKAFALWSDVSPFSFREVPADEEADIKIGEHLLEALFLVWAPRCGCWSAKLLLNRKRNVMKTEGKYLSFLIHLSRAAPARGDVFVFGSWQDSTPSTTPTASSPTCTIVSTASRENWLTHSFRKPGRSTSMTTSTGFWETCASAGRKASLSITLLTPNKPLKAASGGESHHLQACLCCRGLADGSRPRGHSRNRPRFGSHALHGPEGHHAPERNPDGAQADHAGRGLGLAPPLWCVHRGARSSSYRGVQSKLTQRFGDVLLNVIFKSLKTEELTHRSDEWNLQFSLKLESGIPAIS